MVRFCAGPSRAVPKVFQTTGVYPLSARNDNGVSIAAGPINRVAETDLSLREALGNQAWQVAFSQWPANLDRQSNDPTRFPVKFVHVTDSDRGWLLRGKQPAHLFVSELNGAFYYGGASVNEEMFARRVFEARQELSAKEAERDAAIAAHFHGKKEAYKARLEQVRVDTVGLLDGAELFTMLEARGELAGVVNSLGPVNSLGQEEASAAEIAQMSKAAQRTVSGAWIAMEHARLHREWVGEEQELLAGRHEIAAKFEGDIERLKRAYYHARRDAVGFISGHASLIERLNTIANDPDAQVFPSRSSAASALWERLMPTMVKPGDVVTLDPQTVFGAPGAFEALAIMLPTQNIMQASRQRVVARTVSYSHPIDEMRADNVMRRHPVELTSFTQYTETGARHAYRGEPQRVSAAELAGGLLENNAVASHLQMGALADRFPMSGASMVFNAGPSALRVGQSEEQSVVLEKGTAAVIAPAAHFGDPLPAASLFPMSDDVTNVVIAQNRGI